MENMGLIKEKKFWYGKRVLITGHTGFKGSWLTIWLKKLGASITGVSLEPDTNPSLYKLSNIDNEISSHICDINNYAELSKIVRSARPEIVFHLAAQPLVRRSYNEPLQTFSTNTLGTANLLESLRNLDCAKVAVFITTDKVYSNNEWNYPYRENDTLGGHDPYSASKAACELIISSYKSSFLNKQGLAVGVARAGNVIGGGDWSEDRLIPDAIRSWQNGEPLEIRRPESIRPWQHVLDPLAAYINFAEILWDKPHLADAYNFGPETTESATVRELVEFAKRYFSGSQVIYSTDNNGPHEAGLLSLDISKAKSKLGINPNWDLQQSLEHTFNWYVSLQNGLNARDLCEQDINDYEQSITY